MNTDNAIDQQTAESQTARNTPSTQEDDEISLIDLFSVMLRYKALIIGITAAAMVAVLAFSIISLVLPPETSPMPNQYTPQALMLINDTSSSGGSLSSMLDSSGLGSLASLAGLSVSGGQTYSALAVFLTTTNTFLDTIVDEFGLIEKWEIEKSVRANSRKQLSKLLTAEFDEETGVLTVSFTDKDPVFAQQVVDFAVDYLEARFTALGLDKTQREKENIEINIQNAYDTIVDLQTQTANLEQSVAGRNPASVPSIMLEMSRLQLELKAQEQIYEQLKVQYELAKIQIASETPVFQILERPEVPDLKSKPSRGMLCIIVTFAAGFLSVFLAFLLNAIDNVKKDPEAMAKLQVGKKQKKTDKKTADNS